MDVDAEAEVELQQVESIILRFCLSYHLKDQFLELYALENIITLFCNPNPPLLIVILYI